MEKNLSKQASSIETVVSSSAASIHRAVEELARRSNSGSDTLAGQARMLKDVSATLMSQLGGLTKRFEEQGAAIVNASRTFEVSNTKMDSQLEARQAALARLLEGVGSRAAELDRMMNSYSHMLEQSLSQAELRARKVTELLAKDSAEKSQTAIREIERLRENAQTHTAQAVSELQANFSSLSDQVSQQLTTLSTKFNDTTRHVRDTTRRASADLETAQTELQRHAKVLPETAKQSATAMRRALQDQLSALDALSDLSSRHVYASAVSSPEQRAEPRRDRDFAPPPAPPAHDPAFAPLPPARSTFDFPQPAPEKPVWAEEPAAPVQNFSQPTYQNEPAYQAEPMERKNQWSLGDLLARASEDDEHEHGGFPESGNDPDTSYGMPPIAAPVSTRGGPAPEPQDRDTMDFNMAEIAESIDERRVMEAWHRLKRGETEILHQRGLLYTRQGQVTVDRVRRRYETDDTFRIIVERYCSDFEKMLQELSRSDPRGNLVQERLAADNGRIYFILAHISGRLG